MPEGIDKMVVLRDSGLILFTFIWKGNKQKQHSDDSVNSVQAKWFKKRCRSSC